MLEILPTPADLPRFRRTALRNRVVQPVDPGRRGGAEPASLRHAAVGDDEIPVPLAADGGCDGPSVD